MVQSVWDQFAKENAEYYIDTDYEDNVPSGRDRFWELGKRHASRIFEHSSEFLSGRARVGEFGCGIGRLLLPMAEKFDSAAGVDISPTMLKRLEEEARSRGYNNVRGFLSESSWDAEGPFDLFYSYVCFQHVESEMEIQAHMARISAALGKSGVAYFQFDTRPRTTLYRLRNHLPDPLLPRSWRSGIRRVRRPARRLLEMARHAGLRLMTEHESGTEVHCFVFKRLA